LDKEAPLTRAIYDGLASWYEEFTSDSVLSNDPVPNVFAVLARRQEIPQRLA
jgi:hypothetical protein